MFCVYLLSAVNPQEEMSWKQSSNKQTNKSTPARVTNHVYAPTHEKLNTTHSVQQVPPKISLMYISIESERKTQGTSQSVSNWTQHKITAFNITGVLSLRSIILWFMISWSTFKTTPPSGTLGYILSNQPIKHTLQSNRQDTQWIQGETICLH